MYLGKRGPRPKRSSSSLALEPYWRQVARSGITAEWNGGPEQGTALIHVLPELQRLERYERRAFSKRRRALQDL